MHLWYTQPSPAADRMMHKESIQLFPAVKVINQQVTIPQFQAAVITLHPVQVPMSAAADMTVPMVREISQAVMQRVLSAALATQPQDMVHSLQGADIIRVLS